jgi:hypothetical protein
MPLTDWMANYPQVQALLQQPEEEIEYAVDGDAVVPHPCQAVDPAGADGVCGQPAQLDPTGRVSVCPAHLAALAQDASRRRRVGTCPLCGTPACTLRRVGQACGCLVCFSCYGDCLCAGACAVCDTAIDIDEVSAHAVL